MLNVKKVMLKFLDSSYSRGLLPLGLPMLLFALVLRSGAFSSLARFFSRLR